MAQANSSCLRRDLLLRGLRGQRCRRGRIRKWGGGRSTRAIGHGRGRGILSMRNLRDEPDSNHHSDRHQGAEHPCRRPATRPGLLGVRTGLRAGYIHHRVRSARARIRDEQSVPFSHHRRPTAALPASYGEPEGAAGKSAPKRRCSTAIDLSSGRCATAFMGGPPVRKTPSQRPSGWRRSTTPDDVWPSAPEAR